jgi:hypothetical protein
MVALVLADEALRKFGGDSLGEFVRNADAYREQVHAQAARVAGTGDGSGAPLNWVEYEAFPERDGEPGR